MIQSRRIHSSFAKLMHICMQIFFFFCIIILQLEQRRQKAFLFRKWNIRVLHFCHSFTDLSWCESIKTLLQYTATDRWRHRSYRWHVWESIKHCPGTVAKRSENIQDQVCSLGGGGHGAFGWQSAVMRHITLSPLHLLNIWQLHHLTARLHCSQQMSPSVIK